EPPAWSCLSLSCGAAVDPAVAHDHACTLTLPPTVRFAVVPTRPSPLGPEAFVTLRATVPPATVPFRLSGRQFDFAWSPDLPGPLDVEVEVEVCGPLPGEGAASANDATMPAAKSATRGMKYFMKFLSRGVSKRCT